MNRSNEYLTVIYRDKHILVIDKPAGLICHPVGSYQGDTLLGRVKYYFPNSDIHLVHRLDQYTSGIMIIALQQEVVANLNRQFCQRQIFKKYYALVDGEVNPDQQDIHLPLSTKNDQSSVIKIKINVDESGLLSHTHYKVIYSNKKTSLLEVTPHSGRKHQIRVHLSAIGHPIIGDKIYRHHGLPFLWKYYLQGNGFWKNPLNGHGLHSHCISFKHPISNEEIFFNAPIPNDWKKYLKI